MALAEGLERPIKCHYPDCELTEVDLERATAAGWSQDILSQGRVHLEVFWCPKHRPELLAPADRYDGV